MSLKRPAGRLSRLRVFRQQQQADDAMWAAALLLAAPRTRLPAQKAAGERAACRWWQEDKVSAAAAGSGTGASVRCRWPPLGSAVSPGSPVSAERYYIQHTLSEGRGCRYRLLACWLASPQEEGLARHKGPGLLNAPQLLTCAGSAGSSGSPVKAMGRPVFFLSACRHRTLAELCPGEMHGMTSPS